MWLAHSFWRRKYSTKVWEPASLLTCSGTKNPGAAWSILAYRSLLRALRIQWYGWRLNESLYTFHEQRVQRRRFFWGAYRGGGVCPQGSISRGIYKTLLTHGIYLEAHFEVVEPLGEGCHDFSKESFLHEQIVVDWVFPAVRLKCS